MSITYAKARTRSLHWLSKHNGFTEQPAGSNTDNRSDGIRRAQLRLGSWLVGLAWCGVWAAMGLLASGVKGVSYRQAGVANIEDDARASRRPFSHWVEPHEARRYRKLPIPGRKHRHRTLRASLVVLFGRGVHVETVIRVHPHLGLIRTYGGNTSKEGDTTGSQSNGGCSAKRWRRLSDAHGFAIPDYS